MLFVLVGATVISNMRFLLIRSGSLDFGRFVFPSHRCVLLYAGHEAEHQRAAVLYGGLSAESHSSAATGGVPLAMGLGCGQIVLTVAVLGILITAPLGALGIDLKTYRRWLKKKSRRTANLARLSFGKIDHVFARSF